MLLLLQPNHFNQLFSLMASLSEITTKNESGHQVDVAIILSDIVC